jgi:hypothetical protein
MTCNNSSNINVRKTYVTVTNGGSRLMINIPDSKCATGVTGGSVIRYDPEANFNTGLYKLSTANTVESAEVVGIIESINTDKSKNVVIYGSINLPSSSVDNPVVGPSGGSGGADIYFLSSTTSGKVTNIAPTDLSHVVKPIYQTAPHGNGSYTGVVMNYIGYKIDGADLSSTQQYNANTYRIQGVYNTIDPDSNSGIGLIRFLLVDTELAYTIPDTFVDMTTSHILPITEYPDYFNYFDYYSAVYTYSRSVSSLPHPTRLFIEYAVVDSTHIVNSSYIGKYIFNRDGTYYTKIIDYDPANNAYLLSHNLLSLSQNVTRTQSEQPSIEYGISNTYSIAISIAGFFKFTSVSPYGYHTPIMTYNPSISDIIASVTNLSNFKVIPILKVKKDVQAATTLIENNQFQVDNLQINNENINYVLQDLETRLQAVETRLLID